MRNSFSCSKLISELTERHLPLYCSSEHGDKDLVGNKHGELCLKILLKQVEITLEIVVL